MKLFEKIKLNKEREVRFLGLPICQYGEKTDKNGKEKYLEIFPKSLECKTLDKILSFVPKGTKHDHIWIVRTIGLGEAQLLNFMMTELTKKWNMKNPCFMSSRKIYKEMFGMYSDVPFYHLNLPYNDFAPFLKHRNIKYKNIWFHIHHCTIDESMKWLNAHRNGDCSHATISYKELAGIKEFTPIFPHFSEGLKQATLSKIGNLNLDKFVFLVPEANGALALSDKFWKELTQKLTQKGYDIFVNTANGVAAYGNSARLNIAEATYLASQAKAIIGLRCGFIECLAALKDRNTLYTLYTPFRAMSSNAFFETYTLKQYPFVNKNIVEWTVTPDNENEILSKIAKDL
jgi:hypothetical protein